MPQANANAGVKSQRAIVCCRNCEVSYIDRHDVSYDRLAHGRYFELQERQRDEALARSTKKAQHDQLQSLGLKRNKSVWLQTDPAFDPFRMNPQEVCHILPNGLGQSPCIPVF